MTKIKKSSNKRHNRTNTKRNNRTKARKNKLYRSTQKGGSYPYKEFSIQPILDYYNTKYVKLEGLYFKQLPKNLKTISISNKFDYKNIQDITNHITPLKAEAQTNHTLVNLSVSILLSIFFAFFDYYYYCIEIEKIDRYTHPTVLSIVNNSKDIFNYLWQYMNFVVKCPNECTELCTSDQDGPYFCKRWKTNIKYLIDYIVETIKLKNYTSSGLYIYSMNPYFKELYYNKQMQFEDFLKDTEIQIDNKTRVVASPRAAAAVSPRSPAAAVTPRSSGDALGPRVHTVFEKPSDLYTYTNKDDKVKIEKILTEGIDSQIKSYLTSIEKSGIDHIIGIMERIMSDTRNETVENKALECIKEIIYRDDIIKTPKIMTLRSSYPRKVPTHA